MTGKFIILIAVAWMLQILLGLLQIKAFNKKYVELRRKGRVTIGKVKGKLRAGTVVLIAIDNNCNIIQAEKIQGLTVFARLKVMENLVGENLLKIDPAVLDKFDKLTLLAVEDAINNYRAAIEGGEG
ncbi:transcriptional regulator GutM [Tepidimicrobium xylanilyticum]|uniref:transcriptional regulator GutM n=1 Tax=Tepidimicrobium xylanilyticum TaxID=1123352 RepID=UPI002652C2C3|nr:transcriptional regulator GutM [Tepidimicrobium xylanilyticum]GMG95431.1 sorbitol operon activator protein (glucitol) [Tepidimicrobium xylanilyticum]